MDGIGEVFSDAYSYVFDVEAGRGRVCGGGDCGAVGGVKG